MKEVKRKREEEIKLFLEKHESKKDKAPAKAP